MPKLLSSWLILGFLVVNVSIMLAISPTSDDLLEMGDNALSAGQFVDAAGLYEKGIAILDEDIPLLTVLSLHTNLGTAYSSVQDNQRAIDQYQSAIKAFYDDIDEIVDKDMKDSAAAIASQASFYLGMVHQDENNPQLAADAYGNAVTLDNNHWSAVANLGSLLHDNFGAHEEALQAYNKAYNILTLDDVTPTDPPEDPNYILSQLQYRIGLCLIHDPNRKCYVEGDEKVTVSCLEMAAHAFALSVKYDETNEPAKHMLATVTADATMERASNRYVKSLFDDYAHNFEHSLVQELGYTGYERLRRSFDRAVGETNNDMHFRLVVDAGCGTGLVGEQFRNISGYLIGVDLSQAILDEAEKARPGLYDERIEGDVIEVFERKKPISLIIAGDSYIYFGDLHPLFESMGRSLAPGGYAAFTLENVRQEDEVRLNASTPDWRWQLTPSGRFAHKAEYVSQSAEKFEMKVIQYEPMDGFRYEQGTAVRGHIFVLQKQGAETKETTEL